MNHRISHYQYKHWQIEKKIQPKEGGEPYWIILKYPGDLKLAVQGLLDLETGEITTSDVNTLVTAVEGAENRILAAIEDAFVERGK